MTREWARRLASEVPAARVVIAEAADEAARAIVGAEAAFETIPPGPLRAAGELRWLAGRQTALHAS